MKPHLLAWIACSLLIAGQASAEEPDPQDALDDARALTDALAGTYAGVERTACDVAGEPCAAALALRNGTYATAWGALADAGALQENANATLLAQCRGAAPDPAVCLVAGDPWRSIFGHDAWDDAPPPAKPRWEYLGCSTAPDGQSHAHIWIHDPWWGPPHQHIYVSDGPCPSAA